MGGPSRFPPAFAEVLAGRPLPPPPPDDTGLPPAAVLLDPDAPACPTGAKLLSPTTIVVLLRAGCATPSLEFMRVMGSRKEQLVPWLERMPTALPPPERATPDMWRAAEKSRPRPPGEDVCAFSSGKCLRYVRVEEGFICAEV